LRRDPLGAWRDEVLEDLIIAQAQIGFAAAALEAAGQIGSRHKRIEMMKEVALAQAQLGKKDECQKNLALACETVQKIYWNEIYWNVGIDGQREWKNLAIAQARQEFFSDALETVHKIRDKLEFAEAWLAIASVQLEKKQAQGSAAFIEARKVAEAFTPPSFDLGEEARTTVALTLMGEEKSDEDLLRAVTLVGIDIATAVAQRKKGDTESVQKTLAAASQVASGIGGEKQKKHLE
jgi:hypothetical protein